MTVLAYGALGYGYYNLHTSSTDGSATISLKILSPGGYPAKSLHFVKTDGSSADPVTNPLGFLATTTRSALDDLASVL
jgi:hypothetical protein